MSHNRYLAFIGLAGIISFIGWLLTLYKLDPFESFGMALVFFFITFFLALTCIFAIGGFYFRLWLNKGEIFYAHLNVALRQGMLLSLLANGSLAFQLLNVLTWWTGLLLIIAISLVESYFSAKT